MLNDFKKIETDFKKIEEWLNTEYLSIQSGRATPAILDNVQVESYGVMSQIRNIASISIEDAKTLRVLPWDKSIIKSIEKAIVDSNLGLGLVTDSDGIRLSFPLLTGERRLQIVKILGNLHEEARIRVRKLREDILKEIDKKSKEGFSEDEKRRATGDVQKLVDETNKNLEEIFNKKQTEILN